MLDRLPGRSALLLALVIWTIHALIELSIAGQFTLMPLIWAAHGFILMILMSACLAPALRWRSEIAKVLTCALLIVVFAVAQTITDMALTLRLGDLLMTDLAPPPGMELNSNNLEFQIGFKLNLKYYIWLFGFFAAFVALMTASRDRLQALEAAQRAEVDALRLQVNPHFLFNALNSISSLIVQGEAHRAEAMTLDLARYYRGALDGAGPQLVDLDDELEATASYLEVERARLGERLDVTFDVADDVHDWPVPPLILQPIVENAVKHGFVDATSNNQVMIQARQEAKHLVLTVSNALMTGEAAGWGAGVGLANVRNRLAVLFGPTAKITSGPNDDVWLTTLKIPR